MGGGVWPTSNYFVIFKPGSGQLLTILWIFTEVRSATNFFVIFKLVSSQLLSIFVFYFMVKNSLKLHKFLSSVRPTTNFFVIF